MTTYLIDLADIVETPESGTTDFTLGSLKTTRVFSVQYKSSLLAGVAPPSANLDPAWVALNFPNPDGSGLATIGQEHPLLQFSFLKCIRATPAGRGCRVELSYESPDHEQYCDLNGERYELDWGVKQQHATTALWGQTHIPETAASMGNTIGADGEEVKGCDVQRPYGTLKVTKRLTAYPNAATIRSRNAAIGCINGSSFMQGAIMPGEALCTGVNHIRVCPGYTLMEVTFNLLIQQPSTTITLQDGTTATVSYYPWQHAWYRHQGKMEAKAGGGKYRKLGIESIHVANVYPTLNFASTFNLTGPTYAS